MSMNNDPNHNDPNHNNINDDPNQMPRAEMGGGDGKVEPNASCNPRESERAGRPKNQRKRSRPLPQRVPAIPATKFVRFMIDYIGGGRYQLSVQGRREIPKPIAVADDAAPLLDYAFKRAEPRNEIVVAPVVALTQVVALPTAILALLQKANADPFDPIGSVIVIPSKEERDQLNGKFREAIKQGAQQPPDDVSEEGDAKQVDDNSASETAHSAETYLERLAAAQNATDVPESTKQLLANDAKSGGRLGWIFESKSDGTDSEGDTDKKGDGDGAPPGAN